MPSRPDVVHLQAREYASVEALPEAARMLLGGDFFSGASWYRTVIAAGLEQGARTVLLTLSGPDGLAALFPLVVARGQASSLTTPYSCLWRPLIVEGAQGDANRGAKGGAKGGEVWRGFAAWCRQWPIVRLEALDESMADAIAAGMHGQGMVPLRFDQFGNWHGAACAGWAAYLGDRPGELREAVRRRTRRLLREGGVLQILRDPQEIEAGITAYEAVYAKSWKAAEPYPAFNAILMREAAAEGAVRLGLLRLAGQVIAAQIWAVRGDWAAVLKLAHDEAARAHSPGTVLTAMMIEHLVTHEGVRTLDFGRGDDAYKASWTDARRQRVGLLLANPRTLGGLAAMTRHAAGRMRRKTKEKKFFASFFQERRTVFLKKL